jgi:hypothetical protein
MSVATGWTQGRGLLGPLKPLLGEWVSPPEAQVSQMPARCTRTFRPLGKGWIELDACWEMPKGEYREVALFGAAQDGALGFYSFTSDGKRSEGRLAEAGEIHPSALAFEAKMPAGLARMLYWPLQEGSGFHFAVESRTQKGWNRFLRHTYRPIATPG